MKLKGHTTIELRNVETGEVKKYEDDNMFTNAIGKMINFAIKHSMGSNPLDVFSSHWYNLLGGLVMFDSALTESADNIFATAGVKPAGYGMVGDTSSYQGVSLWGIYNPQESDTSQTDTKKMVWDFATSHANGTIASICLTHRNAAMCGFGMPSWVSTQRNCYGDINLGTTMNASSKGVQGRSSSAFGRVGSNLSLNDGSYMHFCIDGDNDYRYQFKVCQDGLSIIKVKMSPETFDVFRSSQSYQSYTEETYSETFSGTHFYHCYNPTEKVLYFWTYNGDPGEYFSGSVDFYIHKFDMTSKVLTKNWKRFNVSANYNDYIYTGIVVCNSGIYYVLSTYANRYPCFKKVDTTSGTISTVHQTSQSDLPYGYSTYGLMGRKPWIMNGVIYYPGLISYQSGSSSVYYEVIIDTSDDTFRYTNLAAAGYNYSNTSKPGQHIVPIDNTQIVFSALLNSDESQNGLLSLQSNESSGMEGGNVFAPVQYLATINNLSEAIVKTAQQTMKVTYTITAAEEE